MRKSQNRLNRYPLLKIEYNEFIDKKTDAKLTKVKIFLKLAKFSSWSEEYEEVGNIDMDTVFGYADVLRSKGNFFRKEFVEDFSMFSVSDIVYTDISYDVNTKTLTGTLVNEQLANFFNIEQTHNFNIVKRLLKGNIRFYNEDDTIQFGNYVYENGVCYVAET